MAVHMVSAMGTAVGVVASRWGLCGVYAAERPQRTFNYREVTCRNCLRSRAWHEAKADGERYTSQGLSAKDLPFLPEGI